MSKFEFIECGKSIPKYNIHAVSVSIPTFKDVIDYEENRCKSIKTGYPRFVLHPYLKMMCEYIKEKYNIEENKQIVLVCSKRSALKIASIFDKNIAFEIDEDFGVLVIDEDCKKKSDILKFIQYAGTTLSSRYAEDFLYKKALIKNLHVEKKHPSKIAYKNIIDKLSIAYKQPCKNIGLSVSGMHGIYSLLAGIKKINPAKDTIIQLGWLYLDTMNIIEKYCKNFKIFYDLKNLDLLEDYLHVNAHKVHSIVIEFPTNPLLKYVDIKRLKEICNRFDIALIVDTTFCTPYNFDFKQYADIMVESLTKFACGNADVMMGALIVNENSKFAKYKDIFFEQLEKPYIKDLARLSFEIEDYEKRVEQILENKNKLVDFLKTKNYIKKIYHCDFSGVISLTFNLPFQKVYDELNFFKGPSLGTEFTLCMPYVYLAHYDLINKKEDKNPLKLNNIPIDLLRVSVGLEDIESIKKEFDKLSNLR
ncbi:PLP-dependent transferase [Sulfurospirillum sp. 1307]